jgi:hypothetical protein
VRPEVIQGEREEADARNTSAPALTVLRSLHEAYYSIPAGEPTTEQVMERLPALYEAVQAVLDQSAKISGLLFVVTDAMSRKVTVHVATEATCSDHLAAAESAQTNEP